MHWYFVIIEQFSDDLMPFLCYTECNIYSFIIWKIRMLKIDKYLYLKNKKKREIRTHHTSKYNKMINLRPSVHTTFSNFITSFSYLHIALGVYGWSCCIHSNIMKIKMIRTRRKQTVRNCLSFPAHIINPFRIVKLFIRLNFCHFQCVHIRRITKTEFIITIPVFGTCILLRTSQKLNVKLKPKKQRYLLMSRERQNWVKHVCFAIR